MAKPRVTATNKLSNVIDVVEMGRRNGMLSVERGGGSVLEVGEIYFVSGVPAYAALAGLRGREALQALGTWGPCRFAFDTESTQPPPNIFLTDPSLHATLRDQPFSTPPSASPRPAAGRQGTGRLQTRPLGPRQTGPFNQYDSDTPPNVFPNAGNLGRRPRRAPDVRDLMMVVTTYNLSRNHRTVLLLADGEHTILDLARLSSKSVDEITVLLADLESRGLVYYYAVE
jgi:Domain of unknown function (DUF4388)